MTDAMQEAVDTGVRKPEEQIVATGDGGADLLVSSAQQGLQLVGLTLADSRWPATAGKGFDMAYCSIDGAAGQTCARLSQVSARVEIVYAAGTCAACPGRHARARLQTTGRAFHLRP